MNAATIPAAASVLLIELQVDDDLELPDGVMPQVWAAATLAAVGRETAGNSITLRIVGRDEGERLNRDWRDAAVATNVLAFPAPELPGLPAGQAGSLGDLVICLPVLDAEARTQGITRLAHLAHLVVHGSLHLLGYDHQTAREAARMESLETRVLTELGFADPYAGERP